MAIDDENMSGKPATCKVSDRRVGKFEIYVLSPPMRRWRGWWWVYAPLARASILLKNSELRELEKAARGGGKEESRRLLAELSADVRHATGPTSGIQRLLLVPTAACNFHCNYCFSAAGHSFATLSENAGKAAIDYYLAHSAPNTPLDIAFLGGGEPTLELPLADRLLDYAELHNAAARPCRFSIVTNGGGNVVALIGFALRHKASIGFSFDILRAAQERNRGHYDCVEKNLRALLSAGVSIDIKATITPDTTSMMEEMIRETGKKWPSISSVQMEPVLSTALYTQAKDLRAFYSAFTTGWFRARKIAKKVGVRLGNSLAMHARLLLDRYCNGTFLVGPNGVVTACEFVSSPKDPGFEDVLLGRANTNGRLVLDGTGTVASRGKRPGCEMCFAKWHCAGGCGHRRLILGEELDTETCRFTRRFLARVLFTRMEEALRAKQEEANIS